MRLLRVVAAELWREIRLARSYPIDFVAEQVLYTLGVLLLSGIFQLVARGEYDAMAQLGLLVGYLTWRVADGTLLRLLRLASDDTQWGTLEQLWLTSVSPDLFLFGRMLAIAIYQMGRALLIALVVILLLRLTPVVTMDALFIFLLSQAAVLGLGFALVGLHLVYKDISAITLALSTALLFLTGALAPLDPSTSLYDVSRFLPLTMGVSLLRESVVIGAPLYPLVSLPAFSWLIGIAVAYTLAGFAVWKWTQRIARIKGLLAHY